MQGQINNNPSYGGFSDANNGAISQSGNDQTARIDQADGPYPGTSSVWNNASIAQDGSFDTAHTSQPGSYNTVMVTQAGNGGAAAAGNDVSVIHSGNTPSASAIQTGCRRAPPTPRRSTSAIERASWRFEHEAGRGPLGAV